MAAALLVAVTIYGAMASMTSTDEVANTFAVGPIRLTLDEAKADANGDAITEDTTERVKANRYRLYSGNDGDRDSTVHITADNEDCYVSMMVTINCQNALDTMFTGHEEAGRLEKVLTGLDSAKRFLVNANPAPEEDSRTYEFRYVGGTVPNASIVPAASTQTDLPPLFTGLKASGWLTNEDISRLENLEIKVFDTADAAWANFPTTAPTV